jgi:catechol 2,3-dioxygenase-like lactoylglutathione lyase family enzyme
MPRTTVTIPTLHADQVLAYRLKEDARGGLWAQNAGGRFKVVRCGRRWGKTAYGETWACDGAIKGEPVGWFAPAYKYVSEAYQEISDMLKPVTRSSSKTDGVIRTVNGGRIDFWTLENESAGRSRKYRRVYIDEAAFTNPNMLDIWERSIKPTLLDYQGKVLIGSNTNGVDPDNFMYQVCNDPKHGFIEYHAPSWNNPLIPERLMGHNGGPPLETDEEHAARRQAIFDDLRAREHPLVFAQEYGAEFVDWSGVAFFSLDKMLEGPNKPWAYPTRCHSVFAIIDSATKTGTDNDGTGVAYYAYLKLGQQRYVYILDWDIHQMEGALLEVWLPTVLQNLEALAMRCGAQAGSLGALIEDKNSGEILLQQARRRNLRATAIDSRLTALGKDERAISVSGYVYRGEVRCTDVAFDKVKDYKGTTRNHFLGQVVGFRVGDKDAAKRADDLLDTFTYGVAIALGDSGGF